jgi:SAM-dependent methyltransferase
MSTMTQTNWDDHRAALIQRAQSWIVPLPQDIMTLLQDPSSSYEDTLVLVVNWINNLLAHQMTGSSSEAVYTKPTLHMYDDIVWGFNSPCLWHIVESDIQDLYNRLASARHAEVAVGTGLFLTKTTASLEAVTLIDLNPNTLSTCRERMEKTNASIKIDEQVLDILQDESVSTDMLHAFDSVAVNFLLHCLGGSRPQTTKTLFKQLSRLTSPEGVCFGSTILGRSVSEANNDPTCRAAHITLNLYNQMGIFSNLEDDLASVEAAIKDSFEDVSVRQVGHCAVWEARKPRIDDGASD